MWGRTNDLFTNSEFIPFTLYDYGTVVSVWFSLCILHLSRDMALLAWIPLWSFFLLVRFVFIGRDIWRTIKFMPITNSMNRLDRRLLIWLVNHFNRLNSRLSILLFTNILLFNECRYCRMPKMMKNKTVYFQNEMKRNREYNFNTIINCMSTLLRHSITKPQICICNIVVHIYLTIHFVILNSSMGITSHTIKETVPVKIRIRCSILSIR